MGKEKPLHLKGLSPLLKKNNSFDFYFRDLWNLAVSRFEWHNLPTTIDPRFLELILMTKGSAVFFYDEYIGHLALPVMMQGDINIYDIPTYRTAFSYGYYRDLSTKDSVIIYNNAMRCPTLPDLIFFAEKLSDIDNTIRININAQKTPLLITTNEKTRLTTKNALQQYQNFEDCIVQTDFSKINDAFNVINTQAPFVADKLYIQKINVRNEFLNFLGIETNIEKKERLIESESIANNGNVEMERYVGLNTRRQACDLINSMFGLNISVDFRSNTTTIDTSENLEVEPIV